MKFLSLLISILVSLFFLEILTRIYLDNGMNYEIEMQKYAVKLKKISNNISVGIEHKVNKKALLMGAEVNLNSYGFRNDKDFEKKNKKVLMIGDSMTFGWGANKPFPNIINDKIKNYDVINAGIGNTNTIMQINNFFYNFKNLYSYDAIILNFYINDLEKIIIKKPNFIQKYFYSYTFISQNIHNLFINSKIKHDWIGFYKNTFLDKKMLDETFSKIIELNDYCKKNSIKFYIHNIPELRDLQNYKFIEETKLIETFANKNNINFINSYDVLKIENESSLWVTNLDPHANDKAHKIIAEHLIKKIFSN